MRLLVFAALAVFCQGTNARGESFRGFSFDNSQIYDFFVEPGNSANRWDSATSPVPLTTKQADGAALTFMKKIQVADGWEWNRSKTRLHQISKKPEEWIYVVSFIGRPRELKGGVMYPGTGIPRFDVVVQMDGRVPEPRIQDFRSTKKGRVPNHAHERPGASEAKP